MSNVDATMVSIPLKMNVLHIMSATKAFNTQISIAPMDCFSMNINQSVTGLKMLNVVIRKTTRFQLNVIINSIDRFNRFKVYWDCFKGCKKDTPTWLLWTCHAKCGETSPMTKSEALSSCSDGIYKVDDRCDAFYMCFHGFRTEVQYCPDGLLFNNELGVCDWPDNVACSGPF